MEFFFFINFNQYLLKKYQESEDQLRLISKIEGQFNVLWEKDIFKLEALNHISLIDEDIITPIEIISKLIEFITSPESINLNQIYVESHSFLLKHFLKYKTTYDRDAFKYYKKLFSTPFVSNVKFLMENKLLKKHNINGIIDLVYLICIHDYIIFIDSNSDKKFLSKLITIDSNSINCLIEKSKNNENLNQLSKSNLEEIEKFFFDYKIPEN